MRVFDHVGGKEIRASACAEVGLVLSLSGLDQARREDATLITCVSIVIGSCRDVNLDPHEKEMVGEVIIER